MAVRVSQPSKVDSPSRTIKWERLAEVAVVVALVVLAAGLRLHRFGQIPYPGDTSDELAYMWSGWSWLHQGVPTAWSDKPDYLNPLLEFFAGHRYRLVSPWLDHPPLFSLLLGVVTTLAGASEMFDTSLAAARSVSVALGTFSVALLYLLARQEYGRRVAILAALLFATIPTFVVTSRLALAESLIVPLFLGGLLAALRYRCLAPNGRRWLVAALICAGAASMAKVPGLTVGISLALLLLDVQRRRAAVLVGLGGLVGLLPYVGYGLATNPALFAGVAFSQSSRATGLSVLPNLLVGNVVPPVDWSDAWIPFLWLALAYAAPRRDRFLGLAVGPYLVFLVAAVPSDGLRVWYREPLFPFLSLAGALFLREVVGHPNLLSAGIVLFAVTFGRVSETLDPWSAVGPVEHALYPLFVMVIALPFVVVVAYPGQISRRVASSAVAVGIVVALGTNVVTIAREDELYPPPKPLLSNAVGEQYRSGLVLDNLRVEPDTVPPGGVLRLATAWTAKEDVAKLPVTDWYREVDPTTHAFSSDHPLGGSAELTLASGAQTTLLLNGQLPSDLPIGDYDIGLWMGSEKVELGVIRVRASTSDLQDGQSIGLPATFQDGLALDQALLVQPRQLPEGIAYELDLTLRATRPLVNPDHLFVHLESATDERIAQSDGPPGESTDPLAVGTPILDQRQMVIPPSTPPGRYYLIAGVYEPQSGRRLAVNGADHLSLGAIDVGPALSIASVTHRLDAGFASGVTLVGYDAAPPGAAKELQVNLYWRASEPLARDETVFVHLTNSSGVLLATSDGPPDRGRVPTSTWRPGQIISDLHVIPTAGLPPGRYQVRAGLYPAPSGPPLAAPGHADGAVPVLTFEVP